MPSGLTSKQVKEKIEKGQVNATPQRMIRSNGEIIRSNVLTYFNLINIVLFILVLTTGQISNGLFITTIIANTLIGIYQQIKARNMLKKLSILVKTDVEVKRDGQWTTVKADEIVLGDLVRLKAGMQIPSDAQMCEGYLEVNESMLTGESNTQIRKTGDLLYGGTIITSGSGEAEIIHVGKDNYSETIMKDARKYNPSKSQLNMDMEKLLHVISIIIIPTGIVLFLTHYFALHLTWQEAILKTVSAVIGMIPEGLVVLTSVALAVSTIRLAQVKVLVQDLYSIETLARVDVLCTDKTGTLTQGSMQVTEVVPLEGRTIDEVDDIMGSYVRMFPEGNATSNALSSYFKKNEKYENTALLPFSSERKFAGAGFRNLGSVYTGAVNFLFPDGFSHGDIVRKMADDGDRVLVVALDAGNESADGNKKNLKPIALISIRDVLRPNVQKILQYFDEQGVAVKVISGDDPRTVSALAQQAGLKNAERYVDMSQQRFRNPRDFIDQMAVFGRVLPEQKKAMVKALQEEGHTVAMIGDGVNDVPALKTADVSIAMAAGSSAASDSANIVLLNNDFGMMPEIVKEGRRVINNISRASSMYLVKTVFSVLLSLYVIIGHREYPFLPIHLSLISSFGVGIPTFFLQMESSFERIKGRFFARAFRNAVPTSITILLMTLLLTLIESVFGLSEERFNFMLLFLTIYAYLYTLYRVYYPLNKYRFWILVSMSIAMTLAMILFHDQLQISFAWMDLLVILPGLIIVPLVIAAIARIYDKAAVWISKAIGFFRKRKKA